MLFIWNACMLYWQPEEQAEMEKEQKSMQKTVSP